MGSRQSFRRHWRAWTFGFAAVVIALVVGVPFVYIHFVEGAPPAPLALSKPHTTPTTGAPVGSGSGPTSIDGSWRVTTPSQAGYRIKESLFGQSNTAVGRTSAVTGKLTIAGATVADGTFSVDMTKVTSDQSQRDNQFRGRIMNTAQYPTGTFTLTQPIHLTPEPADGVQVTAGATGNLTLHGTTKSVTFTVTAQLAGGTLQVSGTIPVVFADYNISDPSGGPASTESHGNLEFLLTFKQG